MQYNGVTLQELSPIPQILSFNCPTTAITTPIEQIYKKLPDVLIPFLISITNDHDSCVSQVIRLCMASDYTSVDFCPRYEGISLNRCNIDTRFILFLIDLVFINERNLVVGRHSEAVLIDSLFGTIEFFEPNGPIASWYSIVLSFLEDYFKGILPKYKFLATSDFCPMLGPQAVSSLGICGSFSLLFLWLRIDNPDMTSGEIIQVVLTASRQELNNIMYKFICFIDDYSEKHNLYRLQYIHDRVLDQIEGNIDYEKVLEDLYYKLDLNGIIRTFLT